ncbi:MAG: universal stress protein [Dehalococcoidia bacterium]|nr:universal stress protein [Dehalococcoidia bacterium]
MYEKILVPLDGSELAEIALPYAEELAGALGSEVTLIHVFESAEDKYQHMYQLYMEKMVEVARQGAERHGEKPVKVDSVYLVGHTAEQIVDYADREKIGLIAMATHGRSGIRRWFLGNVAAKVVRATERPVALIRAKDAHPEVRQKSILNKVLVPLDGSKESEAVIPHISELASKLKAEVVLFQVVAPAYFVYSIPGEAVQKLYSPEEMDKIKTKSEGYLDTVGAELRDKGINAMSEVGLGVPAEEIIRIADEIQADVVAMSTHGHSGISRWAFGSTADKVLHAGNTPVLLVRASSDTTVL